MIVQVAPAYNISGNIRKHLEIIGNMSPLTNNGGIHKGILRSAFYSAKIEGNTLTIEEALEYINELRGKSYNGHPCTTE